MPGLSRAQVLCRCAFPCAGVWRRKAIESAGGWNSRTTVEDMDLSLRAYLAGWKAIYLRHVTVLNEVCHPLPRLVCHYSAYHEGHVS